MKWEGNRESSHVDDRRGDGGGGGGPGGGGGAPTGQAQPPPADDRMAAFVSTVLADTEDVWKDLFTKNSATCREPWLVLFCGATPTRLRLGPGDHGAVLLPARPENVHRSEGYETLKTGWARRVPALVRHQL